MFYLFIMHMHFSPSILPLVTITRGNVIIIFMTALFAFISMINVHIVHFTSEALGHRSHLHVAAVALGVIQTIAGTGTVSGYSGDGGQASNAQLNFPARVDVDQSGRIYICETSNHAIRMVDTTGIITTVAGTGTVSGYSGDGGQASNAQLNGPRGVSVDQSGRIYIADWRNHAIRKVDTTGIITTVAGTGTGTVSGYSGDGGQASSAKLFNPYGVSVDQSGRIYIVDTGNHAVRMVDTTGIISTVAGTGTVSGFSGDGGQASSAKLFRPIGSSVDQSGRIYVADYGNHAIRMVDTTGIITTVAGTGTVSGYSGDGGQASSAKLFRPYGVYVDQSGRIYIADTLNQAIRMIDTTGIITTVAGTATVSGFSGDGGQALSAKLHRPEGVSVDQSGRIYIADTQNDAIRMFQG
jgi:sugar lactone lactonase YvrE